MATNKEIELAKLLIKKGLVSRIEMQRLLSEVEDLRKENKKVILENYLIKEEIITKAELDKVRTPVKNRTVHCNKCNTMYRVVDEDIGKKFKCKQCGMMVQVPKPGETESKVIKTPTKSKPDEEQIDSKKVLPGMIDSTGKLKPPARDLYPKIESLEHKQESVPAIEQHVEQKESNDGLYHSDDSVALLDISGDAEDASIPDRVLALAEMPSKPSSPANSSKNIPVSPPSKFSSPIQSNIPKAVEPPKPISKPPLPSKPAISIAKPISKPEVPVKPTVPVILPKTSEPPKPAVSVPAKTSLPTPTEIADKSSSETSKKPPAKKQESPEFTIMLDLDDDDDDADEDEPIAQVGIQKESSSIEISSAENLELEKPQELSIQPIENKDDIKPAKPAKQESPEFTIMLDLDDDDMMDDDSEPIEQVGIQKDVQNNFEIENPEGIPIQTIEEEIPVSSQFQPAVEQDIALAKESQLKPEAKQESPEFTIMLDLDDDDDDAEEENIPSVGLASNKPKASVPAELPEESEVIMEEENKEDIEIKTNIQDIFAAPTKPIESNYLSSEENNDFNQWVEQGKVSTPSVKHTKDLSNLRVVRCLASGLIIDTYQVLAGGEQLLMRVPHKDAAKECPNLEEEISLASSLHNPGIVSIYGKSSYQGQICYVTQYLDKAEELRQIWPRIQTEEKDTVAVGLELLYGLAYSHSQNMIHGYLDWENVLLYNQQPYIRELGLNSLHRQKIGMQMLEGQFSPMFMSPEQLHNIVDSDSPNLPKVDRRSDIYSIGAILYWMATKRFPFTFEAGLDNICEQVYQKRPQSPVEFDNNISTILSYIIMKALEKDPLQRYASANEMIAELSELQ